MTAVEALADALKVLAPGVKTHEKLAVNFVWMLRKRGFELTASGSIPVSPRRMTVDPKSYELAQHFLQDEANVLDGEPWALASDIQTAVEDFINSRKPETEA